MPKLIPVPLDELENWQTYLLLIESDWFIAYFNSSGMLGHSGGGSNGMWSFCLRENLVKSGHLTEAYLIEE